MKKPSVVGMLAVAVASASALTTGCSHEIASEGEAADAQHQSAIGQDEFLYFRSGASGWTVDNATRLRRTLDPQVFKATYAVTQSWMLSGDNSIFTKTNQLNGWGTQQTTYGSTVNPVVVPGGGSLNPANPNGFSVRYPSVGKYQVSVNVAQNTFSVQPAPAGRAWEPLANDSAAITTIGVAPQNRNQMVVGYTSGDLYLTFNGLSANPTWTKIDAFSASGTNYDLPNIPVTSIVIGPGDGKTIYASFGGTQQGRKLWKTSTGGQFWSELPNVPVAPIASLSINPLNSQRVYAVADGGAIATSNDGGSTWTTAVTPDPLTPPITGGGRISTIAVGDTNNPASQVWVGTSTGDVFVTFNASATPQVWTKMDADNMPNRLVTRLTLNPRNMQPPEVWATFQGLVNDSIWRTPSGGRFWSNQHTAELPTTSIPVSALALYGASVNPADDNVIYVVDSYGNASRSENRGTSWLNTSR